MKKEKNIINGYPMRNGYSGCAVAKACHYILENPGATQKEVFLDAIEFSGLNQSQNSWIVQEKGYGTDPGPAGRLWERRLEIPPGAKTKRKLICCYPNAFTDKVADPFLLMYALNVKDATVSENKIRDFRKLCLTPGSLVEYTPPDYLKQDAYFATWMGFATYRGSNQVEVLPTLIESVKGMTHRVNFSQASQIMTPQNQLVIVANENIKIIQVV